MEIIKPTNAELEILQVLWKNKSATVKFVHEEIHKKKNLGYTTTLKLLQNMTAKGMVKRELKGRSHVYIPILEQKDIQNLLLDKFLESAFEGSASALVMQVLGNSKPNKEELKQIKELINQLEEKNS